MEYFWVDIAKSRWYEQREEGKFMPILGHIKTAAIHSFFLDSSPRFDHHNLQYIQVPYQYDIKLFLAFSCCFLYIHEFYLYTM